MRNSSIGREIGRAQTWMVHLEIERSPIVNLLVTYVLLPLHEAFFFFGTRRLCKGRTFAIERGLEVCWNLGYRSVVCETDCRNAADAAQESMEEQIDRHVHGDAICRIQNFIGRGRNVSLNVVSRDNYCVTYLLARCGTNNRPATHE